MQVDLQELHHLPGWGASMHHDNTNLSLAG
jgi:hypothetical protein